MLGLRSPPPQLPPIFPSKSKPFPLQIPNNFPSFSTTLKKSQQFRIYAQNGGDGDKRRPTENGDEGKAESGKPKLKINWVDLVLDPDPDNIVAVGLTGLLTWASVQVLWQLFVISGAILLAALKYTIVATLLIFILITLL
ncbi:hypothetical protein ABFS82_06G158800 [Erythranthe guttata]|uniref:Transmembrane protein n=1 Tax=Erythranthe guttata TaxID=4155 RepID=A0A022RCJ4_ERYGU|nr:hypothetical protein MIMGU_mgv1a027143mg [Erythranthe guttata]